MQQDLNLIIVFSISVVILLILDLYFLGRNAHKISTKEAGIWTFVFIAVSLLFAWYVKYDQGAEKSTEFLTAYVIEKTLSVDNLFVFILIFRFFAVPDRYHHKVLFWGILGAIILRAIFIFTGVSVMGFAEFNIFGTNVNFLIFLFGIFLIWAGLKAGKEAITDSEEDDEDFSESPGAKFINFLFKNRVTKDYVGGRFIVKVPKDVVTGPGVKWEMITYATPLLVVVGVVEFTDLLFAVDSIPAIFSVSKDPFILYSSNIFAILGLRSMYFLLANLLPLFKYLNHGLAIILSFIGFKMVASPIYHIDSAVSLFIVLGILAFSITLSLITYYKENITKP